MDFEDKEFKNVGELPSDQMKMPPPYWRSPGTIFHIESALENILNILEEIYNILPGINQKLDVYYSTNADKKDEEYELFSEIVDPLYDEEHKLKQSFEIAILMAAIDVEDRLNMVSTYNLPKDMTNSIEKLSPENKILVISSYLSISCKSRKEYESLKQLMSWRNKFAHGHCDDRPITTVHHNHLIHPETFKTIPQYIKDLNSYIKGFLSIYKYLAEISKNEYTKGESGHNRDIEDILKRINKYIFTYEGEGEIYTIEKMN